MKTAVRKGALKEKNRVADEERKVEGGGKERESEKRKNKNQPDICAAFLSRIKRSLY